MVFSTNSLIISFSDFQYNWNLNQVALSLLMHLFCYVLVLTFIYLQTKLNENEDAWHDLVLENDPVVLAQVMWDWLDHLKVRVVNGIIVLQESCILEVVWDTCQY